MQRRKEAIMKSKQEIEQIATEYAEKHRLTKQESGWFNEKIEDYIKGYSQCQSDMKPIIFEVARQFHRLGKYSGHTSDTHFSDIYEQTLQQIINPKNE